MRFPRISRRSLRLRMTLLYGSLFSLVTTLILLVVQQVQLSKVAEHVQDIPIPSPVTIACNSQAPGGGPCPSAGTAETPPVRASDLRHSVTLAQQGITTTQRTLTTSSIVMIATFAFVICWWLTGRLLRPLQRINSTARRLSLVTLHERIALTGPRDELRELADNFDAMLDRIEDAVASQRRFIANASHELRTPLAVQRSAIEIGLVNPTPAKLDRVRTELLRNAERSERLIEGLLALAEGERDLEAPTPVDLAALVAQAAEEHRPAAEDAGVHLTVSTRPVTVIGDEVMLARLTANLVQNAVRYNRSGGNIAVELSPDATLVVRNTGPDVPTDRVDELFRPFQRLHAERAGPAEGAGLGLSIVAAIAHAHGGRVSAVANPGGGLTVTATFPQRRTNHDGLPQTRDS